MARPATAWRKLKGKPRGGSSGGTRRRTHAPRIPVANYDKGTPEAVVKVAAWGKSIRAAGDLARYIAEGSEHVMGQEQLIDQDGQSHDLETIQAHLVDSWGLISDRENLSPAARKATPGERAEMPEAQRLQRLQVAHLVISWPKNFPIERHQAEAVAAEMLSPFTSAGHKSLMVYHSDLGRPHIHVMLQARNSETGRALVIRPRELQLLRERQVEYTRAIAGREMQATRREERSDLQRQITQGQAPLRTKDKERAPTLLERQAPGWYIRHGYQYEARRLDWKPLNEPMAPLPVRLPRLEKGEAALDQWAARFVEPEAAKDRWREMASEVSKTAFWYANNRPEVFGAVRASFDPRGLNARDVRITPDWQQQARDALASAMASPQIDGHRLAAAQTLREAKRADQLRKTAEYMAELIATPPSPTERRQTLADRIPAVRAFASLYEKQPGYEGILERRLSETPGPEKSAVPTREQQIAALRSSLERLKKETQRLEVLEKRYSTRKNWTEFADQRKKTAERLAAIKSEVKEARERLNALHPPTLLRQIADKWIFRKATTSTMEQSTVKAAPSDVTAPDPMKPDPQGAVAPERTEANLISDFLARVPQLRALIDSQAEPTRGDVIRATDRLIAEDRRAIERLKQTRDRLEDRGSNVAKLSKTITEKERGLADLEKRQAALKAAPISRSVIIRKIQEFARQRTRSSGHPTRER